MNMNRYTNKPVSQVRAYPDDNDNKSVRSNKSISLREDARSQHTPRHYNKDTKEKTPDYKEAAKVSERSISTKDKNSIRENSTSSSTSDYRRYTRVRSSSTVSDPNGLVCDHCINSKLHDNKLKQQQKIRELEREYANQLNKELANQLASEKYRELQKQKLYQEAIKQQMEDAKTKKQAKRNEELQEKEMYKEYYKNKNPDLEDKQYEFEKKKQFINDLKEQMALRNEMKKREKEMNVDGPTGLLIDDSWKNDQRTQLKDFYKDNLLNQINDNKQLKRDQELREKQMENDYAKNLNDIKFQDDLRQKEIERKKKELWLQDIEQQKYDVMNRKQNEKLMNEIENENYKRQFLHDRQVNSGNVNRRDQLTKEYLQGLKDQMDDNAERKRIERELEKARALVSIPMEEKHSKCYNCKICKHKYPLRMLNKKKKF